jgi:DNA-binding transcriptional LysR family regulator
MRAMSSLLGITNFVRTVRAGSFAGAARELNISAVAVSKNVAALERALGVRLLNRSTRALSLTEEGRAFHERCAEPLRALEDAAASAKSSAESPGGLIRVTSLTPFGRGYVIPLLSKFARLYPQIEIDLRLNDSVVDMAADGFDIGIRAGLVKSPSVIAREICNLNFVVCGAPSYFAQRGVPKLVEDLARHNCLRLALTQAAVKADERMLNWRVGPAREWLAPPAQGTLIANDFNSLELAAIGGVGLFNAPLPLVMPHFRSGALRPVLPQCRSSALSIYLYYRSRRNQPARVRVFVDFLLEHLRGHPDLVDDPTLLCAPFWASTTADKVQP